RRSRRFSGTSGATRRPGQACCANCEDDRLLGRGADNHPLYLPGQKTEYGFLRLERNGNLRERAVASPDGDHRVGRVDQEDVPRVTHPGADDDVEKGVPLPGVREYAYGRPAGLFCTSAGGLHHPAEPAATDGLMVAGDEVADG